MHIDDLLFTKKKLKKTEKTTEKKSVDLHKLTNCGIYLSLAFNSK